MGQQPSSSSASTNGGESSSGSSNGGSSSGGRGGYVRLMRSSSEQELDADGNGADDYRWAYVGDSVEQDELVALALQQGNHLFLKKVDKLLKMHEVTSAGEVIELEASLRKLLYFVHLVDEEIERRGTADDPMSSRSQKPFSSGKSEGSVASSSAMSLSAPVIRKPRASVLIRKRQNSTNPAISMRVRDLRRLDFFAKPSQEASIWVRRHCVMFILDPIRAVVMANQVILIVPPEGMDQWHKTLEQHLRSYESYNGADEYTTDDNTTDSGSPGGSGLSDDDTSAVHVIIPFEMHAYEAILTAVQALYTYEYNCIQRDATQVLAHFHAGTGSILPLAVQEKMRTMKNDASRLAARVEGFGRAIASLVESEEIMALMDLSYMKENAYLYNATLPPDAIANHDEVEELLEGHLADGKALEAKINFLLVTMDNAEDLVTLKLNIAQNELLTANTSLAVLAVTIGFGAYLAGVFGMNLDIPDGIDFIVVFAVTMVIIVVGSLLIMGYYQWEGVLPTRVHVREEVVKNDRRQRYAALQSAPKHKAEVEAVAGQPASSRASYGSMA